MGSGCSDLDLTDRTARGPRTNTRPVTPMHRHRCVAALVRTAGLPYYDDMDRIHLLRTHTSRLWSARSIAVVIWMLWVVPAPPAWASTGLDDLFEALGSADTPVEAAAIEQQIWTAWFDYAGPAETVPQDMENGSIALRSGLVGLAERLFSRVIEADPQYAEGWNRRATVRYVMGDYAGSIADIAETLALEPRHFGALSGLGLCYLALGQPEQALAAFEAVLDVHPQSPSARQNVEALRAMTDDRAI